MKTTIVGPESIAPVWMKYYERYRDENEALRAENVCLRAELKNARDGEEAGRIDAEEEAKVWRNKYMDVFNDVH